MSENIDAWLRMYEEQVSHGRHHEEQRSQSTNIIVAISAAILAFLSSESLTQRTSWPLLSLLVIVNLYGLLMSLKHYELSKLHTSVAGRYRDAISTASPIGSLTINSERKIAHLEHDKKFALIRVTRAYALWSGLHVLLCGIGAALFFS